MDCTHDRIKSVNCVIYCDICGAQLPAGFIPGKYSTTPAKASEGAETGEKTATKKTTRKKVK